MNPSVNVPKWLSPEEYFKNQYLKDQKKAYKWSWERVILLGPVRQGRKSAFCQILFAFFNATACAPWGGRWCLLSVSWLASIIGLDLGISPSSDLPYTCWDRSWISGVNWLEIHCSNLLLSKYSGEGFGFYHSSPDPFHMSLTLSIRTPQKWGS